MTNKQKALADLPQLLVLVRQPKFIAPANVDSETQRQIKAKLLAALENWVLEHYPFDAYQAEFVVNQAVKTVGAQPERRLVLKDRRLAVKVARQTVWLANHYLKFLLG